MFGSAGRRDEAKRAIQGKLAGEYADEVIVTEEDDRDIDGFVELGRCSVFHHFDGFGQGVKFFRVIFFRQGAIAFSVFVGHFFFTP